MRVCVYVFVEVCVCINLGERRESRVMDFGIPLGMMGEERMIGAARFSTFARVPRASRVCVYVCVLM